MRTLILYFLSIHIIWSQSFIPAPVNLKPNPTNFVLNNQVALEISDNVPEAKKIAEFFAANPLVRSLNLTKTKITPTTKKIKFTINKIANSTLGKEGYVLDISDQGIKLEANEAPGLFYAMQTLIQCIPLTTEVKSAPSYTLLGKHITDFPRFGWRGLMLDVSRHFFSPAEVKKYIDVMASYKFNTLHLHLTDDNGWRIEIKSLPLLTSKGAWRVARHGRFGDRSLAKTGEENTYGGFYTHDQIRDLVKYASERQITIIPEIDIPGHCMAALAAYPALSVTKDSSLRVNPGTNFAEWYGNGKFKMLVDNTLNPSDEKVYDFVEKVIREVAVLFPGPYIHAGGDECYHGYWEKDTSCIALMKKEGLKDGHELQAYFMRRVEQIVKSNKKKLIGWDEILEGGIAPDATVMSWRGMSGGIEAAKMGHDVVMSPTTFAYIDYHQGDRALEMPVGPGLSLKKAYSFEPVPDSVDAKKILGGQANLWTEQVPTLNHAFYMTYPRALAIAETVWSPKENKDWSSFTRRLESHFDKFEANNINISKALYDATAKTKMTDSKLTCELSTEMEGLSIYYTLDNTFPDTRTLKYNTAFEIPEGDVNLKFITYRNGKPLGHLISISRKDLVARVGK